MTDPINFRALCVNLLDCLEKADWPPRYRNVFGQWASITRVALAEPVADGPAVLASREPAAVARQPSDEELLGLHCLTTKQLRASGKGECNHLTAFARAVLARWGRPTPPAPPAEGEIAELIAQLRSRHYGPAALDRAAELLERHAAPVPIPVSERLPGPEDCDAEGMCWLLTVEDDYPQWRLHSVEGHQPGGRMIWVPVDRTPGVMVDAFYASHWLPARAIPLPALDSATTDEHQ